MQKPSLLPKNSCFSSGPCAKRPGWSLAALEGVAAGRSHRSKTGKAKLAEIISRSRGLAQIPEDYRVGIVPASDTGAVEMVLWSMLGARLVDVFHWESFSKGWFADLKQHLKLTELRDFGAPYGELPDLKQANFDHDVVFAWNGTTSGVKVPNGDFIPDSREGLVICDATSAVFAMKLPWEKLDVITWSWQKVLGSEAAHGMLALSPRAVERLVTYSPERPLPKIFRMTKKGALMEEIFEGSTINTPSMLAAEDCLDALRWAESIGGEAALIKRSEANLAAITEWVERTPWVEFLCREPENRSSTSICLKITAPWFSALSEDQQRAAIKKMVGLLEAEGAGYDLAAYKDAPAGLRIWGGATVETSDIEALFPWLAWALDSIKI